MDITKIMGCELKNMEVDRSAGIAAAKFYLAKKRRQDDWEKPMTPKRALAWLLMGAGAVVGVWLGAHIGFAVLVGG